MVNEYYDYDIAIHISCHFHIAILVYFFHRLSAEAHRIHSSLQNLFDKYPLKRLENFNVFISHFTVGPVQFGGKNVSLILTEILLAMTIYFRFNKKIQILFTELTLNR